MANEFTIEARLGTDKLKSDAKQATSVISQIFGSGQAAGGNRPMSAKGMPPMPGQGGYSLSDEIAKQESKAKASKYSGEAVSTGIGGGMGGGGVNTSGSRFQIQRAVINVAAGKINVVGTKSGLQQSAGAVDSVPAMHGSTQQAIEQSGGGAYSPQSMFSRRPGESQVERAGRGFMQGSNIGMGMGGHLMSITDAYGLATQGVSGVYHAYKDFKSGGSNPPVPHQGPSGGNSMASHGEGHGAAAGAAAMSSHREGGSRLTGVVSSIFPVVGAVLGFIAAGAQRMAESYVSKLSSQITTLGLVGNQPAGGGGEIGELGYSAAAKGQMITQAQQHMTGDAFSSTMKGGIGKESAFKYSAKFAHSQGIGAGAGMIMSAQLAEMDQVNGGTGKIAAGEKQLKKIAEYAHGYEGKGSRRLGGIAQFVTGLAMQQQTAGGVGDAESIAGALSALKGHGSLGHAQHTIQGLSGQMSAGAHAGSTVSGLLMMGAAQSGGSMKDVLKAADKGITAKGLGDLKGIPQEMLESVLFSSGMKMTEAESMAQAVHGKRYTKKLDEETMGGTYTKKFQAHGNEWTYEGERIADMPGAAHAAEALRGLHDASMAATKGISYLITEVNKLVKKSGGK